MLGLVTNIYRDGDPRRPDGDQAVPCLYVTFPGDAELAELVAGWVDGKRPDHLE